LTDALRRQGLATALETSGVYPVTGSWDWVTISPKPQGRLPFDPSTLRNFTELKWVVGGAADIKALERFIAQHDIYPGRVLVQPISASPKATALCLDAVMQHVDWRVSIQLHKVLGIA